MNRKSRNNPTDDIVEAAMVADGEIRINHSVIASIVRYSALSVDGVAQVGGRFIDGIAEIFSKRETDRGVTVKEDEQGRYTIDIRVLLYFGCPLTQVAAQIQQSVAQQIAFMTNKSVAQVNVTIDGIRAREDKPETTLPLSGRE
ncbi:MAG: Asp23/Gls24 family envelope stress response protein [Puniceicoccales bacterium]|jgi:uncharacterized alkaline shock family protein YloU|nr:Asp23/Gls24 family envelope stress response protein [Puniceicoccales bacterium]